MKVLSSAAMKEADRRTMEDMGLPGAVLMETAGLRVAEFIFSIHPEPCHVVVIAGPGNNGGDGLVTARLLYKAGYKVELWSTVKAGAYRGDAAVSEKYLSRISFPVRRVATSRDLERFSIELSGADLVIDAMLGTGLNRDVEGLIADLIHVVNESDVPVLSVDAPSGLNTDTGQVMGSAVRADWTVTFACPKWGLLLLPGAALTGELVVADINIPDLLIEDAPVELLTAAEIKSCLPDRAFDAHKGTMGRVLIVSGSPGMSGAAMLAAESALRGGAGLSYLAAPESVCPALESKLVEVITIALPELSPGIISPAAVDKIIELAGNCDAVAVGPGLNPGEETAEILNKLIQLCPVPVILDAGALAVLRGNMQILRSARHLPLVTPHPGEMARLAGMKTGQVQFSRLETSINFARLWNCIVILKGANTIIATPKGKAFINPTGGPALSTAGTGDLLTGLIASFIAQGISPERASAAAAFIHGLAGDLLPGRRGHMAGDVLDNYGAAFHFLETDQAEAGYINPFLKKVRPLPRK